MLYRPLPAPPGPILLKPPRRRRGCRSCWGCLWPGLMLLALGVVGLHFGLSATFGSRLTVTLLVVGADRPQNGTARSDTLLLVRVFLRPTPQVVALSLPRDTRVRLPGHRGWHKLNAAFALGGLRLTRRTVSDRFGVYPDYHVILYSEGLAAMVEALGGVPIQVPHRMDYDDQAQDLHIHLRPGLQTLNGLQALGFVRFRDDGRGDLGRIERQQAFLQALVKQLRRPQTLLRLGPLWQATRQALDTDLNSWQLLGLAYRLRTLPPERFQTRVLPGQARYIGGVSYYVPETWEGEAALGP